MATAATTTSYWCYRCTRFVAVSASHGETNPSITCPHCDAGFIEEVPTGSRSRNTHRRFESRDYSDRIPALRFRRTRRSSGDRSPFNPVIVLRGDADEGNSYEFYHDDGTGSGLRPVPASISEFLMGSGFDRLLEQLAQIEANGLARIGNPPASKAAVESMPTMEITEAHVVTEAHCAVCKEAFELGGEAREMPCKHIYHSDCILPWLALRNSCPVCRHEISPADLREGENPEETAEEVVGLTIWRLPGGGFAVGRFNGSGGEREFPAGVFTEVDGGGFSGAQAPAPRRVSWGSRRGRESGGGGGGGAGFRRVFRGLASWLRRMRPASSISGRSSSLRSNSESVSVTRSSSLSSAGFGTFVRRRRSGLDLEVENGTERW